MIGRFNEWLALNATKVLLSIWCAYFFTIICLLPLVVPSWESALLYISNCFQLVFLPILGVGQALMGRAAEIRAQEDHEAIMAELAEIKALHAEAEDFKCRHPRPAGI